MTILSAEDVVYKSRDAILEDVLNAWQSRIPDIATGSASTVRLWSEVFAEIVEDCLLQMQLLFQDLFPQTANAVALERYGDMYGRFRKGGTKATGAVLVSGEGGTAIPIESQFVAPQAIGDGLLFNTTSSATIPNPGVADAPVATIDIAGLITGTIEYAITFVTVAGETEEGAASNAVVVATKKIAVSAIPLGGAGTTARKIYRRNNGGAWQFVATLADNTTTTYLDNIAVGSLGGAPPEDSTAERISVPIEAEDVGSQYNVGVGTINDVADSISGITSVTNPAVVGGGSEGEDLEFFRTELVKHIRASQSGALVDLESWAEEIEGVEQATAFLNDNEGTPADGHATVRIAGPNGSVPSSDVVDAVQAFLDLKDVANIIIHVTTFNEVTVNVTVALTLESSYVTADVEGSANTAIQGYLNGIPVGGAVRVAGIYWAVFGLPGVATLSVTLPAADVPLDPDEKAVMGTVTL